MQPTGFPAFLARLFSNKYRESFLARLGTTLLLNKFKLVGPVNQLLSPLITGLIGVLIEEGIFIIDVSLDSYREGRKIKEFEKAADEAYKKATAKIYDEKKKDEIRQQYLDMLSKIVPVGNGPKP